MSLWAEQNEEPAHLGLISSTICWHKTWPNDMALLTLTSGLMWGLSELIWVKHLGLHSAQENYMDRIVEGWWPKLRRVLQREMEEVRINQMCWARWEGRVLSRQVAFNFHMWSWVHPSLNVECLIVILISTPLYRTTASKCHRWPLVTKRRWTAVCLLICLF